nr:EOG090X0IGL [Leptodora kindtii]
MDEKKSAKQATRGQKQIVDENEATIVFYRNMSLVAVAVHIAFCAVFWDNTSITDIVPISIGIVVHLSCLYFMSFMARPSYSETGKLLDGGLDLNMEAGLAEHVKDAVILTSAVEVLAVFSRYFWLLWLVAPLRLAHMLWKNFLGPWFFQPTPDQPEVENEKKQKKLERRMKRQQN